MNIFKRFNSYKNSSPRANVTRGYGLLEYFLAIQRARIAKRFISKKHLNGSILDIGCGRYPIFLLTSKFVEKFGIDKTQPLKPGISRRFSLINYDIEAGSKFPFDNDSIDVITMLAVMEHINFPRLGYVLAEVYRILKPGGIFIVTIPSPWAEHILDTMANLRLVSKIEMDDHKLSPSSSKILEVLKTANFENINFGYFEFFMNRWFVAKK